MDILIAGAGCCGASAARYLAEHGWNVTIADRRSHIGGNAYDRRDGRGILYHVYGPHIFFTDQERVWDFLHPFAEWVPFSCGLRVWLDGESHPMPFQPELFRCLLPECGEKIVRTMQKTWPDRESVSVFELLSADDPLLKKAGQKLYDCDCVPYNQKQWGLAPHELSPEVIARAPVLLKDRQSFRRERFQFMPVDGFTAMFQEMLHHPFIEIVTGQDALELVTVSQNNLQWQGGRRWDAVLYTGTLDRLFGYCEGRLPYRTLQFETRYLPRDKGLPCLAVYYPGREFPWTRRSDYQYLPGNESMSGDTLVIGEVPRAAEGPDDEPYYVVLTSRSKARYRRYRDMADQTPHLYAAGRLADFRYYNMDEAIARGLDIAEEIHRREKGAGA